ncbi:MAG: helix-turn-helix transcriptional regulator [Clostridiales bacterium]|nr:helix-turn-helix transcriptional regulator [Clostridiales bacterium]
MINGLGERLQKQRTIRKLSQKDVACALHVSPSIISNYESGERTPSVEILMALASLYHCSTDYLLGFEQTSNDFLLNVSMLTAEQRILLQHFLLSLQSM